MGRPAGLLGTLMAVVLFVIALQADAAFSQPYPARNGTDDPAYAPGRLLVKVRDGVPADNLEAINRRNDATIEEEIPDSEVTVVGLPRHLSVSEAVERYEASPGVEYAEPDFEVELLGTRKRKGSVTPNDRYFPKLYNLQNEGQEGGTAGSDIKATNAWSVTKGDARTVVAVLDTGIDIGHPDLKRNVWTNPDEIPANGIDDDRNGYVDDVHGWDFHNDDNTVFDSAEEDWHGTHVAGTIAARGNNQLGITGVSWRAKIMPLKFIGPDRGYISDAVEGLNYAVAEGVKISNNSYTYYDTCDGCYSRTLLDAIDQAGESGHLFVAAAGNGNADKVGDDNDDTQPAPYPATYEGFNVVSVAASNRHDDLTAFSNYGATSVDFSAPGIDVLSTLPNDGYGKGWGTSMAAPHAAGVAALIKSQHPAWGARRIKDKLIASVDKKASLAGKVLSGGRLNAAKAVR